MATLTQTLGNLGRKLAAATRSVTSDIEELRRKIGERQAEIKRLQRSSLPAADVADVASALVRSAGASWLREWGEIVARNIAKPGRDRDRALPWSSREPIPWGATCALEPERAEALLLRVVELAAPEAGPARADRPALLQAAEAELLELETAEEQAVDSAAAAGLTIEHRPEVSRRRREAAEARAAGERAAAQALARQRALDEAHGSRRVQASPYLAGQGRQSR